MNLLMKHYFILLFVLKINAVDIDSSGIFIIKDPFAIAFLFLSFLPILNLICMIFGTFKWMTFNMVIMTETMLIIWTTR